MLTKTQIIFFFSFAHVMFVSGLSKFRPSVIRILMDFRETMPHSHTHIKERGAWLIIAWKAGKAWMHGGIL